MALSSASKLLKRTHVYTITKILSGSRRWKRRLFLCLTAVYALAWCFAIFNTCSSCVNEMPLFKPKGRKQCNVSRNDLQLAAINMSYDVTAGQIEQENQHVMSGGKWKPARCIAQQRVAIIIPYRNRLTHLKMLLRRLHPMLKRQNLDYQIFVSEQAKPDPFNRGMTRNVGFVEAMKLSNFDCVAFHDVDMVPEHDGNLYYCGNYARHLSSAIDEHRYHPMYRHYLGGVTMFRTEDFIKINGYPNQYWEWGNEDDEIAVRTIYGGLKISRPPYHIGRYKMARHAKDGRTPGWDHIKIFVRWRERWRSDGLSTMDDQYTVLSINEHKLYTNITYKASPDYKMLSRIFDLPMEWGNFWFLWLVWFLYP